MERLIFDGTLPTLAVEGVEARFPVRRIWCVGSNYRKPDKDYTHREPPYFFSKQPDMALGQRVSHPGTGELRFEVELVVAIGHCGRDVGEADAGRLIFGYAVGLDMTRRDLLLAAQAAGRPWEIGKSFDGSAPVGIIKAGSSLPRQASIRLWQNGEMRQDSNIGQMIWDVPEVIASLSALVTLRPGDLIFTGTPAGHGPCAPGDRIEAAIEGLRPIRVAIG